MTMRSPYLDPHRQGLSTYGYQHSPSASAQPSYGYHENAHAHYGYYAPPPGSYIHPHYSSENPIPIIAELPAPLPPVPQTSTPEEQLKQDELLARRMSQLDIGAAGRASISDMPASSQHLMPSLHQQRSAHSLRPHSRSVSSSPDQRPASMAPLSAHNLAPMPLIHHRSAQSLRPHSRSLGSHAEPWSPGSFDRPQRHDPANFSTLPEVVVGPVPLSYSEPKFASENLPIPVLLDQQPVRRPSIALEPSSLTLYLEKFRQAPYPPQWNPPNVLRTLYAGRESKAEKGTSWLDTPAMSTWCTTRSSDEASATLPPEYSFKFKNTSGSFRSPKFSWTMSCPKPHSDSTANVSKYGANTWVYDLKLDSGTNLRKSEVLTQGGPKSRPIMTTYVHALNYDSLRFIGPDGRAYMWVSSTKVSSISGSRYDTLRHGLFVAAGSNPNPLYGHIVADHCFWDGSRNQEEAHLPDEALYIRSPSVDPALVVATLQIMKDWEKHTLREEKRRQPKAFSATEEEARKCVLGAVSYWRA